MASSASARQPRESAIPPVPRIDCVHARRRRHRGSGRRRGRPGPGMRAAPRRARRARIRRHACTRVGLARQKVNYHLRALEAHGLVSLVEERRWGGLTERVLVATAASYVVSPGALGAAANDPARTTDRLSARYLIALAARVVREVGEPRPPRRGAGQAAGHAGHRRRDPLPLGRRPRRVRRRARRAVAALVSRYHDAPAPGGRPHRLVVAAHPVRSPRTGGAPMTQTTPPRPARSTSRWRSPERRRRSGRRSPPAPASHPGSCRRGRAGGRAARGRAFRPGDGQVEGRGARAGKKPPHRFVFCGEGVESDGAAWPSSSSSRLRDGGVVRGAARQQRLPGGRGVGLAQMDGMAEGWEAVPPQPAPATGPTSPVSTPRSSIVTARVAGRAPGRVGAAGGGAGRGRGAGRRARRRRSARARPRLAGVVEPGAGRAPHACCDEPGARQSPSWPSRAWTTRRSRAPSSTSSATAQTSSSRATSHAGAPGSPSASPAPTTTP